MLAGETATAVAERGRLGTAQAPEAMGTRVIASVLSELVGLACMFLPAGEYRSL